MTYVPTTNVDNVEPTNNLFFEDLSVDEKSPTLTVHEIKETDFVRYAGASGDFNPLHYDEQFAKDRGYDGIFAMGMLSAGILSHLVSNWLGISNITYFKTQFDSIVWPGDDLEMYAVVKSKDPNASEVTLELFVENQNGETVTSGEANATLPSKGDTDQE